jgi:hypothetical protein
MKVSYRIVQEITPDGEWETVGVVALWHGDPPHMQLRNFLQHTVSQPIWGKIKKRVKERGLTLETYHEALADYERYYRILPEIHTVTRATAAEVRHWLREKYIFLKEPVASA